MSFNVKDLMINVLASGALIGQPPEPTTGCGSSVEFEFQAASFAALSMLKVELQRQLAEVEKQEAAAQKMLVPKTVEQVDALTERLNEGLEELKILRVKLSKKAAKAK
jgi:hypothetical protein